MKKLILICLLLGCATSARIVVEEPELTVVVQNNNWNRVTITLYCQGSPRLPKLYVDFNTKIEHIYKQRPCHNARVEVDLFTLDDTWVSNTLNIRPQDKLCLVVRNSLTLSSFTPCRYS